MSFVFGYVGVYMKDGLTLRSKCLASISLLTFNWILLIKNPPNLGGDINFSQMLFFCFFRTSIQVLPFSSKSECQNAVKAI